MTVTWRAARLEDAPAITMMLNANDELAGVHEPVTEQTVREELVGPQWDLDTDTVAAERDGVLLAYGGVMSPPPTGATARAQFTVEPAEHGSDLAAQLLHRLVERAGELRAAAGAAPWSLRAGCHETSRWRADLLSAHGFVPIRHWFAMERDLDGIAPPREVEGVEIREFRDSDSDAAYDAHRAAFADHWGSQDRGLESFLSYVSESVAFHPELSRLALDSAGTVVGYVFSFVEADPSTVQFGLIGTRREWRGRGIAGELVRRALTAARDDGLTAAALHVDGESPTGAVGVYEHLGFRTTHRSLSYALELV